MIYLYGLLCDAAGNAIPAAGVFGGKVELIEVADYKVLAERVAPSVLDEMLGEGAREDDTIMHNAVLAHQAFLSDVASKTDILPFRFGTAVADEKAVAAFLDRQGEALSAALEMISGHLEWGVKVTRSQAARKADTSARPASGADYLRKLSAQKQSQDKSREDIAALCRTIAADVAAMARKVQALSLRSNNSPEARVLNMACLLPRGSDGALADTINAAVGRFDDLPVRIEITGPWPPFSFADVSESDEA